MLPSEETQIRILVDRSARSPFLAWFRGVEDVRARAAIMARLDRLSLGLRGDGKALGGGIHQLRIHHGPGFRIYFAESREVTIVILGGTKRTQRRDVAKVQRLWREYREDEHR